MTTNQYCRPVNTIPEAHKMALVMISDAYLFYLVSLHRRPIYRHQYGDISLNQPALQGFLDPYLESKGWSMKKRSEWYLRILDLQSYTQRNNSKFIDWGTVPTLKPRGIRWINACFNRLGEMVNEAGSWEAAVSTVERKG